VVKCARWRSLWGGGKKLLERGRFFTLKALSSSAGAEERVG
jgi:hypothetical protein